MSLGVSEWLRVEVRAPTANIGSSSDLLSDSCGLFSLLCCGKAPCFVGELRSLPRQIGGESGPGFMLALEKRYLGNVGLAMSEFPTPFEFLFFKGKVFMARAGKKL